MFRLPALLFGEMWFIWIAISALPVKPFSGFVFLCADRSKAEMDLKELSESVQQQSAPVQLISPKRQIRSRFQLNLDKTIESCKAQLGECPQEHSGHQQDTPKLKLFWIVKPEIFYVLKQEKGIFKLFEAKFKTLN